MIIQLYDDSRKEEVRDVVLEVLLEHGFDQGQAVAQLLAQAGFVQIEQRQDLSGHIRCTGGKITAVRR